MAEMRGTLLEKRDPEKEVLFLQVLPGLVLQLGISGQRGGLIVPNIAKIARHKAINRILAFFAVSRIRGRTEKRRIAARRVLRAHANFLPRDLRELDNADTNTDRTLLVLTSKRTATNVPGIYIIQTVNSTYY